MQFFMTYSWLTNLGYHLMDLSPPFLRRLVFSLVLGSMGKDTHIDYHTYIRYPRQVRIGSGTTVNRGCRFFASRHDMSVTISIGNNVAIGPETCFFAAGHDYSKADLPDVAESITVGDKAWIGGRAIVLPGVNIGEGAVIAAGAVCTHDVPPWTIVAGVPARVIRQRVLEGNHE
jgi:acetyltransferase-like isoleucine patch superfamily enzyme